ncbi:hypothetical protein CLAFUW4_13845 [Fulvia fulva]|uniref:Uncharacterized protein n=1 Tax=Passalora fulva TaxID=5499 RepID=A0A9Q8PLE8_PASFU|nr:uncharacterized protein CLAFUR5_13690 [Fulvia fulva]KAK4610228.1 hypothetical protein CLAFUR4_13848 [Fulvia fulva]KAK4611094.1 hypothetical protein CLAFUR0_13852 [Fulvia fulva]UJO24547.1 hypothetical protein CLAFUR5_13690 [Fulvia fulva]WPV22049.1 hypothetical protein CLAFUW4_13845 [Fulvia fulva]WPV37035.1 hypothetical protein CLAFUW7_13853 [Fulvia fulva]
MASPPINPSLGCLGLLAGELRNAVYTDFVTVEYNIEADIEETCKPGHALALVSKQIQQESANVVGPATARLSPCHHTKFAITLPAMDEMSPDTCHNSLVAALLEEVKGKRHHPENAQQGYLRFLTQHMGNDVPCAVVVRPRLPCSSSVEVFGASAKRTKQIETEMTGVLRSLEARALTTSFDTRGLPFDHTGTPRTELCLRDVTNIAEQLRHVVCCAVEENFGVARAET